MASTSTGAAAAALPHQTTVQLPNAAAAAADDLAWLNVNPASTATNMRYAANFSVLEVYTHFVKKELQKQMGLTPIHAINASKNNVDCVLFLFCFLSV